eukprot:2910473-Prymnesium_polylepis.1
MGEPWGELQRLEAGDAGDGGGAAARRRLPLLEERDELRAPGSRQPPGSGGSSGATSAAMPMDEEESEEEDGEEEGDAGATRPLLGRGAPRAQPVADGPQQIAGAEDTGGADQNEQGPGEEHEDVQDHLDFVQALAQSRVQGRGTTL